MMRACNTKSALRSFKTSPRIKRAYGAQPSSEIASTTVVNDGPRVTASSSAIKMPGKARLMSVMRINKPSSPAAQIAAQDAQRRADRAGDQDDQQRHAERHARAVDDAAQHVAAQLVGAEQVRLCAAGEGRRLQPRGQRRLERIVRRDLRRENRRQHHDHQHGRPG